MSAKIISKGDYWSGAIFNINMKHRYCLWRIWVENKDGTSPKVVAFIGLNPSTANESIDDPTIGRCIKFAQDWKYDGIFMINIFSFRSKDPKTLYSNRIAPVGLLNNLYHGKILSRSSLVVCCWGNHGELNGTGNNFINQFKHDNQLYCFGRTIGGHPKHPLYLPSNSRLELI